MIKKKFLNYYSPAFFAIFDDFRVFSQYRIFANLNYELSFKINNQKLTHKIGLKNTV
jgi:ABC-type molybdate transport system ATPase subunit